MPIKHTLSSRASNEYPSLGVSNEAPDWPAEVIEQPAYNTGEVTHRTAYQYRLQHIACLGFGHVGGDTLPWQGQRRCHQHHRLRSDRIDGKSWDGRAVFLSGVLSGCFSIFPSLCCLV